MLKTLPSGMNSDHVFYSAHFMDLDIWEPCVRQVCRQLGFSYNRIQSGVPGTFPTFMVELHSQVNQPSFQAIVLKFFGPLFNGDGSFRVEKEVGHWLAHHGLPIRSPDILAEGQLDQAWSYIVFERVPGVSICQVIQSLSINALMAMAGQMGLFMKALHTASETSLPGMAVAAGAQSWYGYIDFLETQRAGCLVHHQRWGDLPAQLFPQVQDYLLPVEELLDFSSAPHLIHADLSGDHLLGQLLLDSPEVMPDLDPKSNRMAGKTWQLSTGVTPASVISYMNWWHCTWDCSKQINSC